MSARKSTRETAGNRLRQLLDNELGDDEFYQQEMFLEEAEDVDFAQPENDEEDVVDSDFDIPEDEPAEDNGDDEYAGDEGDKQKKKAGYVDPMSKKQLQKKDKGKEKREKKGKGKEKMVEPEVVKKLRGKPGPKPKPKPIPVDKLQQMIANLDNIQSSAGSSKVVSRKKDKKQAEELEDEGPEGSHRKSRRKATVQSSLQTEKKQIESSKKASQRAAYGARTRVDHVYTQEELLEEAKITEEYNIESLRLYHLMELEKKAPLKRVVVLTGPRIIQHSVKKAYNVEDNLEDKPEDNLDDKLEGLKDAQKLEAVVIGDALAEAGMDVDPPAASEASTSKEGESPRSIAEDENENQEEKEAITPMESSLPPIAQKYYACNTITLKDFQEYPSNFWPQNQSGPSAPPKKVATSSGVKAKYRDPKTKIPFSTLEEFKEIQGKRTANSSLSEASKRLSRASTMRQKTSKALKEILFIPNKACW